MCSEPKPWAPASRRRRNGGMRVHHVHLETSHHITTAMLLTADAGNTVRCSIAHAISIPAQHPRGKPTNQPSLPITNNDATPSAGANSKCLSFAGEDLRSAVQVDLATYRVRESTSKRVSNRSRLSLGRRSWARSRWIGPWPEGTPNRFELMFRLYVM